MPLTRPIPEPLVELIADRLRVLGQPVRIHLLDHLDRAGEVSVQELANKLEVTTYNASQQLSVLRRSGIVARRQRGRHALYRVADPSALAIYEQVAQALAEQAHNRERGLQAGT